ncbi:fatty acid desaturase-domain-containing protein [Gaertneriomyces semiglobifer]|nr:fatty acid desaturase-domain-containing protein [Gaertneriomyces semiglobifer]
MGAPRQFTRDEVKKSATENIDDASLPRYTVIHGKVYDLSDPSFLSWHPGGVVALSQVGNDASGAFDVFHPASSDAHQVLANFYAGDLHENEAVEQSTFAKDIQKLRDMIEQKGWYKSDKLWYTQAFFSNLAILVAAIALVAYAPSNILAVLLSAACVAVFWQQSGWLSHDLAHNQVFSNRMHNDIGAYLVGNVFQGFSVSWWKHKHCTHHSVPNVHMGDPDINTMPLLAWSEHALEGFADFNDETLAKFMVTYQPLIYFPLLSLARLNWCLSSILFNTEKIAAHGHNFPSRTGIELASLALHWVWYIGSAFYFMTPGYAFLWISVSNMIAGVLLAAVFSVNHNGMPVYTKDEAAAINFYQLAILTGRDVTPNAFNNWFTGGLNMQIEHHMFPSVPRHNLVKLRPMVMEICEKNNVPYHTTSLATGLWEVVERLAVVSKLANKPHRK